MRPLNLITAGLFAISLAACGDTRDAPADSGDAGGTPMEMAEGNAMAPVDHAMGDGIGRANGTIRSVGSQGDFLTIEHGAFEGDIRMGAMTMGFGIMGDVDLTGIKAGDDVAFMVKQGRDGAYRVMAICNTATDGAECLDDIMEAPSSPE